MNTSTALAATEPQQHSHYSLMEERALELLGAGIGGTAVAAALGVTPATISQMLAQEQFAEEVTRRKYTLLSKHNLRDSTYDALEDALAEKLEKLLPLMMRPMEVTRALQTVNALKRRGAVDTSTSAEQDKLVQLTIPTQTVQHFTVNVYNQVVQTGEQKLVTMQSGALLRKLKEGSNSSATAVEQIEPAQRATEEVIQERVRQLINTTKDNESTSTTITTNPTAASE